VERDSGALKSQAPRVRTLPRSPQESEDRMPVTVSRCGRRAHRASLADSTLADDDQLAELHARLSTAIAYYPGQQKTRELNALTGTSHVRRIHREPAAAEFVRLALCSVRRCRLPSLLTMLFPTSGPRLYRPIAPT
jgi:hypothetical protein